MARVTRAWTALAALVVACAAALPPETRRRTSPVGGAHVSLPAAFTLAALGVLVWDRQVGSLSAPAIDLALAVPFLLVLRLAVSLKENARLLERSRDEALTDALTGCLNRRAMDERLASEVAQGQRLGAALSVMFVDVDRFKQVNDRHGHAAGDAVLREVALRCRHALEREPSAHWMARYGGEEFAILLAGADMRAACVVARQLGETLSSKRLVTKGSVHPVGHVTVSIGVAQARPGEQAAALVERADAALYEAKRTGRNRVCTERAASSAELSVLAVLE